MPPDVGNAGLGFLIASMSGDKNCFRHAPLDSGTKTSLSSAMGVGTSQHAPWLRTHGDEGRTEAAGFAVTAVADRNRPTVSHPICGWPSGMCPAPTESRPRWPTTHGSKSAHRAIAPLLPRQWGHPLAQPPVSCPIRSCRCEQFALRWMRSKSAARGLTCGASRG